LPPIGDQEDHEKVGWDSRKKCNISMETPNLIFSYAHFYGVFGSKNVILTFPQRNTTISFLKNYNVGGYGSLG
jgi:hypothetical protein